MLLKCREGKMAASIAGHGLHMSLSEPLVCPWQDQAARRQQVMPPVACDWIHGLLP